MLKYKIFRKFAADDGTGSGSASGEVATPQFDTSFISNTENFDSEMISENHGEEEAPLKEVATPLKDEKVKQDKTVDSAFAKLRKENEALAAAKKEMDDYNKWIADNFGEHGVKDLKGYKELMEKQLQEQKDEALKEAGYDPDLIREAVKNDPQLRKLFDIPDKQEEATPEVQQAEQDKVVIEDYKALAAEYPEMITKPEDVKPEVWELYDKGLGLSLVEAYTIVNRKEIMSKNQEIGKQKALNNANSKAHLKTESDGGNSGNDVQMPKETLQMYMDMGMTQKQAFAHYKKLYQ